MDVSIVIPTWKGKSLLQTYLPTVLEASSRYSSLRGSRTEIIVVDDAGGDDTPQWLRLAYPNQIQVIELERNRGFAGACQAGFEAAHFPVILLLNNDVRLEADCIAPLVEHFADSSVFAVTGKIFDQKGAAFCNGGKIARFRRGMWSTYENYDLLPGVEPGSLSLLSFTAIGAFSAFDRRKLLEIGGFDPLAAMVEDVEISYRGWKRGWCVRYEPRSVAYHDASQTMDRRYSRRSLDKVSRRSRILMHWMLLHDRVMFRRHLAYILGRILISWLILDWSFYWAVFTGLGNLPGIRRKRRLTRRTMVCPDSRLLHLLEDFYRTAPITPRER
ncbi:MAG TPA: glycosyltransferase [Acidobacteriota bacterium]|nr:glycosyltransferase [Acidobacteriota bacterium]